MSLPAAAAERYYSRLLGDYTCLLARMHQNMFLHEDISICHSHFNLSPSLPSFRRASLSFPISLLLIITLLPTRILTVAESATATRASHR